MALARLVAALAATAFLLPGCLDPEPTAWMIEDARNSVERDVNDILAELRASNYNLVSVSLTDHYRHEDGTDGGPPRDMLHRSHAYLYVDPVNAKYRMVTVAHTIDGLQHEYTNPSGDWTGNLLSGLTTLPALSGAFAPASLAQLENAVDNLGNLFTPPQPGSGGRVNYWLSAIGGSPTWTVTVNDGGVQTRSFVDAVTLTTIPMGPKATPGNPSVAINRPDLNFTEARVWADLTASAWAPDAFPFITGAIETGLQPAPAFLDLMDEYERVPKVLVPPDLMHADGQAPAWGFIYYSPTLHMVKPITVYATLLAVPGNEQVPDWSPQGYSYNLVDFDRVVPSDAAAARIPLTMRDRPYSMGLSVSTPGPVWGFGIFEEGTAVVVDAYTGALESCLVRGDPC